MTHNDLRYEFGPYQLNPSKRILTRNGEGIPLTPKATEILLVLVKHAGQLIEKDELLKEVWPDTFVEEANLSQNIFTLRRALGEDRADPKYIETIARRGYRFDGLTLKLRLTGPEEKKITARYTENPAAYQAYLEGRYHWSRYTREGIEKAINHFRHAIKLDPSYALAYAAVVDCYLRLTTYLPPEEDASAIAQLANNESEQIELRFEWDWRSVERELRRAADLKTDYTSPHQWYFVYRVSKQLYEESFSEAPTLIDRDSCLVTQIPTIQLTPTEEVQILCSVARDQITIGNFEAARLILKRWAVPRKWPSLASLNPHAAADLLFTLGTLFGSVAGTTQVVHGQKQAEAFLNGSIALFAQLGLASRSSEASIELARCYYKQGLFDLGRETLSEALSELPGNQIEIKSFGLLVWGAIERESGRLKDSLIKLRQAASLKGTGPLAAGRCYHELATTLKNCQC